MFKSEIGSLEWEKNRLKLARIRGRIHRRRRRFLHKVSRDRSTVAPL